MKPENKYHPQGQYAHYTTSKTLENLPITDLSLMGLDSLLIQYHIAPISGEITKGGGRSLCTDFIAFTHMYSNLYLSLDQMIINYSTPTKQTFSTPELQTTLEYLQKRDDITAIVTLLLRQQQAGDALSFSEELKTSLITKYSQKIEDLNDQICLMYIATKFFVLQPNTYQDYSNDCIELLDDIYSKSKGIGKLLLGLLSSNDNDETIYQEVKNIYCDTMNKPSLQKFGFVILAAQAKEQYMIQQNLQIIHEPYEKNVHPGFKLLDENLILKVSCFGYDSATFITTLQRILYGFKMTERKIEMIQELLNGTLEKIQDTTTDLYSFSSTFPTVFIVNEANVKLHPVHDKCLNQEYRVEHQKLKLGTDITEIAVPEEYVPEVTDYLTTYHLEDQVTIYDIKILGSMDSAQHIPEVTNNYFTTYHEDPATTYDIKPLGSMDSDPAG